MSYFSDISLDALANVFLGFLEKQESGNGVENSMNRMKIRNRFFFSEIRKITFPIIGDKSIKQLELLEGISYSCEYYNMIKYGIMIFLPEEYGKEGNRKLSMAWDILNDDEIENVPLDKIEKHTIHPLGISGPSTVLFKNGVPEEGFFIASDITCNFGKFGWDINKQIEESVTHDYIVYRKGNNSKLYYFSLLSLKERESIFTILEKQKNINNDNILFNYNLNYGGGYSKRNTRKIVKHILIEYYFYKQKQDLFDTDIEIINLRKEYQHQDVIDFVFPPSYGKYLSWNKNFVQNTFFYYGDEKEINFRLPLEIDSFFVHFGLIALNEYRSAINTIDVLKRGRLAKITFIVRERLDELRAAFQEQLNKDNQSLIFEQDMFVFDMENAENGNKNFYWFHLEKEGDSPSFYSYNGETKEIQLDFSSFSEYVEKKAYRQILLKEDFGEYFFNAIEEEVQQSILRYLQKKYGEDIAFI